VEFELFDQPRRLPGHCPVCEPKRLAAEAEAERIKDTQKRQEPYHKHFAYRDQRYAETSLDTFEQRDGFGLSLRMARRFAEQLPTPSPAGLLIHGTKGNGKTSLVYALAVKAEALGMTVAWIDGQSWLRAIGSLKDADDREEQIRLACRADMLVIDDLGADKMTMPRAGWLLTIIDAFYRKKKPMALTTNFTPDKLVKALTPEKESREDADPVEGERIVDRLAEAAVFVPNTAPSYRIELSARRLQEVQDL
jgi:DNA replication protein DnaC